MRLRWAVVQEKSIWLEDNFCLQGEDLALKELDSAQGSS